MNEKIILKFLEVLSSFRTEINSRINTIVEDRNIRSQLSTGEDFSIDTVEQELIEYVLKREDSDFDLEDFQKQLRRAKFYYDEGTREPSFKISSKYINATAFINEIESKIAHFCSIEPDDSNIHILESRKQIIDELLSSFNGVIFRGNILDLKEYDFIFEENDFTEKEILTIYEILVKGYCEFLREQMDLLREQTLQAIDEDINNNIDQNEPQLDEEVEIRTEEILDSPSLSEEQLKIIELCNEINSRYAEQLSYLSERKKSTFEELKKSIDLGNNDLNIIKDSLNTSDYKLFLAYCIKKMLPDLSIFLHEKDLLTSSPEFAQMVDEDFKACKAYCDELKALETPTEEEEITESDKKILVFYGYDEASTMFEKSIKDIPQEKYEGIYYMLQQMSIGNFGNAKPMSGSNNPKVKLFEIQDGNTFVVYGLLPKNHIVVYSAFNISDMYKSKVSSKLDSIAPSRVKSIADKINDGTLEYRKMMSESEQASKRIESTLHVGGNVK